MDEKEELKQELQWVKYRQNMLDLMEEKLLKMKLLAEQAKQRNLTTTKLEELSIKFNNLVDQVRALDGESRRTEEGKVLE